MRIRSFIIAYALVLAILLFADRRPGSIQQDRYSHVVDLTDGQNTTGQHAAAAVSRTRIIAPGALIPGTWAAFASLSTFVGAPNARSVSAPSGKLRQHGTLGGLSTTPVLGSSGPGEQIPMPLMAVRASGARANRASTAPLTAANPVGGSAVATIGTRAFCMICPVESTRPAATLVPPTSTPIVMSSGIGLFPTVDDNILSVSSMPADSRYYEIECSI